MARDMMTRCQVKRKYKIDGAKEWRWCEVAVTEVREGEDIRCLHCHGNVRVHRQKIETGPQDHVEHKSRDESKSCQGGHSFEGTHRQSAKPVA
ncbi:MAG: hypothetical protein IT423_07975 [Pirellulaceae bacterium]|nr:hypothetical protein [Pirellulaceae bacterium]